MTTNVFVYLSTLPAVSCSATVVHVLADRQPVQRQRLRDHERRRRSSSAAARSHRRRWRPCRSRRAGADRSAAASASATGGSCRRRSAAGTPPTPDRCVFVSALVSTTFGAGAAGVGVDDARDLHGLRVGALIELEHVAGRAAGRLASRICVSPGAAAGAPAVAELGCSVVACVAHVATGPLVSISSAIVL